MVQYPIRQSLQRTAAATALLALVLATVPVVPTLEADGDLTFSSGTAQAKGKGGGNGGGHGRGNGGGHNGHADRGYNGHADRGQYGHTDGDENHGHAVGFGHTSERPGLGLGHEKARGYGHHHDANYDGNYDGGHHDHDYSDQHNSDPSFSGAMGTARRDFGRVGSKVKEVWNGLWD